MSEEILVNNNGFIVQKLSLSLDTPLNEVRTHLLDEFKENNFLLKIFPVDIKFEKAIKLKDIYEPNLKMIFLISATDFPKMLSYGNPITVSESPKIQNTSQKIQNKQNKNEEDKKNLNPKSQPKEEIEFNEKDNEEVIRKFNKDYYSNISSEDKKIVMQKIGNAGFSTLCKIYFTSLKTLEILLSINTLGALVKARFGNNIKELILNRNFLKEIDELAQSNLPCLERLELGENRIESFEPLTKCNFPNLNYLLIGDNACPDVSFLKDCKFKNLKEIFLYRMGIENIDVLAECNFPELEELNFSLNKIRDIQFIKKCNFKKLKILNFKSNEIENADILRELDCKLKKFYPYDNKFTSYDFIKDMDTSEMNILYLGSCNSGDIWDQCNCSFKNKDFYQNIDIKFLEQTKFPELTKLNLSHIQFKELPVLSSENYPKLEEVIFNFTCFSDMSPLLKWKAKKLKSMSFIGNTNIKATNENVIAYNDLKKDNKDLKYYFYESLENNLKSAMVIKEIKKNPDIPDELYKIHPHEIQLMNGDELPIKTQLKDFELDFVFNKNTQYENYIPYYYCEKLCSICRRECIGIKVFYCEECNIRICMECKDYLLKYINRLKDFHQHQLYLYYNRDQKSWRCDKCNIFGLRCDTPHYRCSLCDADFCLRCVQEDYNHYLYESQHPSNIGKIDVSKIDKNISPELQNLHEHQFTFYESISKDDYEDSNQCGFCKMNIEGQKVIRCKTCKVNICMNCQKRFINRDSNIGKNLHQHQLILAKRNYRCDKCVFECKGFSFACKMCDTDYCINCFTNTKAVKLDSRVPERMAQLHNRGGKLSHYLRYGEFNQLSGSKASEDLCRNCNKSFKNQKLYYCNDCPFRACEDCGKLFIENKRILDEDPNHEIEIVNAAVYDCSKCKKKQKKAWKIYCHNCKKIYCPECVFGNSKPKTETKSVDDSSKNNENSKSGALDASNKDELIKIIHPHKIQFIMINIFLGVNSNRFNCLKCKKNLENKKGYLCRNCPITLCEECFKPIMEVPEKSKLHSQHQLIMFGDRSFKCDICKGSYKGLAFTCKTCNFDSCYNCYTTKSK